MWSLSANTHDALSKAFDQYLGEAGRSRPTQLSLESKAYRLERSTSQLKSAGSTDVAPLYRMQQVLRPLFGKEDVKPPAIGDHPDFEHLRGTDNVEFCPITTMFMDIEGSTRLGIVFKPEEVFRIKNAFIRAAIEVITSFDGHVHRIMGDAVMAYFGGCRGKPEDAAIDALNCAAILRAVAERVVAPRLSQIRPDYQFGIRIGLDFGPEDRVLWSSYGYPMSEEVTATSFFVDVASKLQQAASRNSIMVGESLRDFIDVPDELLSVKTVKQLEREIDARYVSPNHTGGDGKPINYRQHVFDGDGYLGVGPVAQHSPKLIGEDDSPILKVKAEVSADKNGPSEGPYHPCTGPVAKGKWIRFTPILNFMPRLPYHIYFNVENHGKEAFEKEGERRGSHSTPYTIQTEGQHKNFSHWESTAYRGLHYMTIDVNCHAGRYRTRFGVWVE